MGALMSDIPREKVRDITDVFGLLVESAWNNAKSKAKTELTAKTEELTKGRPGDFSIKDLLHRG